MPIIHRSVLQKYYHKRRLKQLLDHEAGYVVVGESNSVYELLVDMLFDKHPELVNEYSKRDIGVYDVLKISFSSKKLQSNKSLNPLIDVVPSSFVSGFLVTRT